MMNNTDAQIVALLKERDEALKLVEAWRNSDNAHTHGETTMQRYEAGVAGKHEEQMKRFDGGAWVRYADILQRDKEWCRELLQRDKEWCIEIRKLTARAEQAEAQIAALRAALQRHWESDEHEESTAALLSDTAAAAEQHDAAVRRAALEDAADYIRGLSGAYPEMDSVADEIETFDEEGGGE